MSELYMLDTDTVSYSIKHRSREVVRRLREIPPDQICVSVITHAELLYGLNYLPSTHVLHPRVHEFLATSPTVPWDADAAAHFANIRYRLERLGTPIGVLDIQIAAHAIAVGAILVTNNLRHFERIGPPLMLENWHKD